MGRILGIAVVMAVLAALVPGRFGGHAGTPGGPLRWQSPARTSAVGQTPGDHLLFGRVVNHSGKTIRLRAAAVHVLDAKGRRLTTRAAFADGFVPAIMLSGYGELYGGEAASTVGREVVLRTGQATPISAAYRAGGGRQAAMLDYGAGRLALR